MTQGFEMKNTHDLKTDTKVFQDVLDGNKTFEIRFNDRDFQVGDGVLLKETQFTGEQIESGQPLIFTGREIHKRISYLLSGYGLQDGWVILGIVDESGQQSQQAKIDSLNKNIEALHVENDRIQKEYQMMFEGVQGRQKTIDELQGRIDELKITQNNLELKAEDAECVSMSLDDQGVEKCDDDGKSYSLWGRVCQFKKSNNITERDELQARLNEALRYVVDHGGYDDLTHVINILKGNKDEK